MNYWEEAFCAALEDIGLELPANELIVKAGKILEGAHESYGMAYGYDCIPNPLVIENEKLRNELIKEREMTICKVCNGDKWLTSLGPYHSSTSLCHECGGEGKILR
jgi:hypothetical protein